MKQKILAAMIFVAATAVSISSAAPITRVAYKDSTKLADTLVIKRGLAINIVPVVSGGPVDSFVLVGANVTLPAGITLNKTTGALTGTATATFAAGNRTIRAYGTAGTDSLSRTVRISAVLLTGLTWNDSTKAADTLKIRRGLAFNRMPTFLNGPVDSFKVMGTAVTLPAGITLDKTTGAISGTATATFAAANRTIRAYGSAGTDSATRTVRISAVILTGLAWGDSTKAADTLTLRRGTAFNRVPTFLNGPVDSFVVVGTAVALPAGITLDKTTGAISGTATATFAATNRNIRAYGSAGTDSVTRTVRISSLLLTGLTWNDSTKAADTLSLTTGVAFTRMPTFLNGPVDSFVVVGATATLPAGVTVNKTTGLISGTATAAFAAANRTIRAYGSAGTDSVTRTVRIGVLLGTTQNLSYDRDTVTLAVGVPATNNPRFIGRAPSSYSVTPGLPAGLSLNTTTGVIFGKPTAVTAATNYTVTGVDSPGTATRVVRLTVAASEDYATGWTQHKTLWINTAANFGGTTVTGTVLRIPLVVRLTSANFTGFAQVAAGRADIRFTKADNATPIPFEIERWDSAGGAAEIWVLADTVQANNSTQNFRMHWGKTAVLSASTGAWVFDTANGQRAVYHMNGDGTGTSNAPNEVDATLNAYVAGNRSTVDVQAVAVVGRGRDFNGTNEHFRVAAPPGGVLNFAGAGNYTLSAWANPAVSQANRVIVAKGRRAYALRINAAGAWEFSEYNNSFGAIVGGNASTPWSLQAVAAASASTVDWHHVVGVSAGVVKRLYVDGVLVTTNAGTAVLNFGTPDTVAASTVDTLTVGREADTTTGYWGGDLDEVRVESGVRSADYIKLSYENQRTGGGVVVHALPTGVAAATSARAAGLSFQAMGQGILFRINGEGLARVTLIDMWGRTVWEHATQISGGVAQLAWDGRSNDGHAVSAGVYAVRATVSGKGATRVFEARIPLTR